MTTRNAFIADLLKQSFSERPQEEPLQHLSREIGVPVEDLRAIVDEVWPPLERAADPVPFLLIRLGEDVRPGAHLSPEFHVCYAGWDGDARVRAVIHGPLDRQGWSESPRLTAQSSPEARPVGLPAEPDTFLDDLGIEASIGALLVGLYAADDDFDHEAIDDHNHQGHDHNYLSRRVDVNSWRLQAAGAVHHGAGRV